MSLFKKIFRELTKTPKVQKKSVPKTKVSNEAFSDLHNIYKKNKLAELDIKQLILNVNPEASANKCPYCKEKFEFSASRARKCSKCSNKMIVRQGLF